MGFFGVQRFIVAIRGHTLMANDQSQSPKTSPSFDSENLYRGRTGGMEPLASIPI
jgi:hypothetical protein